MMKAEELELVQVWDKTFPKSDQVDHYAAGAYTRGGVVDPLSDDASRFVADYHDNFDAIPFDKLQSFFGDNLK